MIHTKIHTLLEYMRAPHADKTMAPLLVDAYSRTPHYVLTDDLAAVMTQDVVVPTLHALVEADVVQLPYPACLVELSQTTTKGGKGRAFVWLSRDGHNQWLTHLTYLHEDGKIVGMHKGAQIALKPPTPEELEQDPSGAGVVFEIRPTQHSLDHTLVYALGVLLTLTHTRGVARDEVTADSLRKLNKARRAHGKQEVLPYTVFRIGHVYNSKGERVAHVGGGKMRPHLRAGHTRRQRYGTGRSETKLVFIEPVLVNCESADEVQFKPKVVTW